MKFLKQFSLYTLVGFINAGLGFLLMPYLSHHINPEGYGILSMVNSLVTILIPLVGLTASGLISVEYYRVQDKREFASIFSSIQAIPLLPGLFLLLCSLLFSSSVAHFFEIPADKQYWIPLSVLIALFSIYYETLLAYNVVEQKPVQYLKFSVAKILIEISLTLSFISIFDMGWEGRLLSWLVANIISFFISLGYFKRQGLFKGSIKKKYLRAGILFGLPLIMHSVGKFVVNQSDRIFIAKMVSLEEAGIYNIGYQVGMVMLILVSAITNFIQPFLFTRLSALTESAKVEIVKTSYFIMSGLMAFLLFISFITPFMFSYLIDENYSRGTIYVFWTGLSYFLWGIYMIFAGYIFYSKKTSLLGYLSLINVILNIILNYYLIRMFGALGACYATCISYFIIMVIIVYKATSIYSLPWLKFKYILSYEKAIS